VTGSADGSTPPSDAVLLERVLLSAAQGATSPDLPLLEQRLADPTARERLRRRLESYASAAPEYIDEDLQAAARTLLGRYFREGQR
jgi:hypothetical protein